MRSADGRRPPRTAVGAGDDVFAADDVGKGEDAIGYQFWVLDEIGGAADDTRSQDLPAGSFTLG
jgi:hypothetical protein